MIVLAPHFDDALLALPARLIEWKRSGTIVSVAILFSREGEKIEALCAGLLGAVGATVHALGLEEAGKRGVEAPGLLRPDGNWAGSLSEALINEAARRLGDLIARLAPDSLIRPSLGIHVDHALTLAALERLGRLDAPCYVDQPYGMKWPAAAARAVAGRQGVDGPSPGAEDARLLDRLAGYVAEIDMGRFVRRRQALGRGAERLYAAALS